MLEEEEEEKRSSKQMAHFCFSFLCDDDDDDDDGMVDVFVVDSMFLRSDLILIMISILDKVFVAKV